MDSPSEAQDVQETLAELEEELRDWWDQKDSGLNGTGDDLMEENSLWADLPEIDSKTAAQAAPICEDKLDINFDMSMIQEGGYESIDDFIEDLLPQLREKIADTQSQDNGSK